MPVPEFVQAISNNLKFWRAFIDRDSSFQFELEQPNLLRAIEFGLICSETRLSATELLLSAFVCIERQGSWLVWIPLFEKALTIPTERIEPVVRLLNALGYLYRLNRKYEEAIQAHKKALEKALLIEDSMLLGRVYLNLSQDMYFYQQYQSARRYAETSLHFFEEIEATQEIACAFNTIGLIEKDMGNMTESERWLRQAVNLQRTLTEPIWLGRWLVALAIALQNQGQIDEAQACYEEARILLNAQNTHLDYLSLLISLGTLYFMQRQLDKAEAHFCEAERMILHQPERIYHQALVAYNLGNVLLYQEKLEEAERQIQYCLPLWQKLTNISMEARALGVLGEIFTAQRDYSRSIISYDEALALLPSGSPLPAIQQLRRYLKAQRQELD